MMDRFGLPFQPLSHEPHARAHGFSQKRLKIISLRSAGSSNGTGAGPAEVAVLNADDEYGPPQRHREIRASFTASNNPLTSAQRNSSLIFPVLRSRRHTPDGKTAITSSLVGRIKRLHILAAVGAPRKRSLSNETIESGIKSQQRFRPLSASRLGQPFLVIVDYAHTDDALQNLISNRA